MSTKPPVDWSPADNPYSIAVSQAQWWQRTARLAILRLRDADDRRISWFSSRQIDARQLVFALRQILIAERLEQVALQDLGIDPAVSTALAEARTQFEVALPGIQHMRDALTHFDEWSRGQGWGPQKDRVRAGDALRDVARQYWGFAFDPNAGTITLGPYSIEIHVADRAAVRLSLAIARAAWEVDKRNTADLRATVIAALTTAKIEYEAPGALLTVSRGNDLRIWLSLNLSAGTTSDEHERRGQCQRIVGALADAGILLEQMNAMDSLGPVERLVRGEALCARLEVKV